MIGPAVIIYLGCMVEEALQHMADGTMRRERLASNSQALPSVTCFLQTVTHYISRPAQNRLHQLGTKHPKHVLW